MSKLTPEQAIRKENERALTLAKEGAALLREASELTKAFTAEDKKLMRQLELTANTATSNVATAERIYNPEET